MKLSVIATIFVAMVTVSAPARLAYAQSTDGPLLLAPLPGTFQDPANPRTTLREYLPAVFRLSIGLAALTAVLVIIFAGLEYMFSTSSGGTGKARQRITAAVSGLIMVLAAWLILRTINPKLVNFNLNIQPATVTVTPGGAQQPQGRWAQIPQNQDCLNVIGPGSVEINATQCGAATPPAGFNACCSIPTNPQVNPNQTLVCMQRGHDPNTVGGCRNGSQCSLQTRGSCESGGGTWDCNPCSTIDNGCMVNGFSGTQCPGDVEAGPGRPCNLNARIFCQAGLSCGTAATRPIGLNSQCHPRSSSSGFCYDTVGEICPE